MENYLYYILMDDDIFLKMDHNNFVQYINLWREFESFLEEIEPAVGVVDINGHKRL